MESYLTRPLASGTEHIWLSMIDWKSATDGGASFSGNVQKGVMTNALGERFFVKKYHKVLQHRDPIYELIGQRVVAKFGMPAAQTYLSTENALYILSRDFLKSDEKIVTLRSLKIESKEPELLIDFFVQKLNDRDYILKLLLVDSILNNGGRHTGNIGFIMNAEGRPICSTPVFDTVAFDNTRLNEAAKCGKRRWITRTTGGGFAQEELVLVVSRYLTDFELYNIISQVVKATLQVLKEAISFGLITQVEYQYMLDIVLESAKIMTKH